MSRHTRDTRHEVAKDGWIDRSTSASVDAFGVLVRCAISRLRTGSHESEIPLTYAIISVIHQFLRRDCRCARGRAGVGGAPGAQALKALTHALPWEP